ncbi:torsin-1A-interacting protein 2-like [Rhinophrynus dorsalis]
MGKLKTSKLTMAASAVVSCSSCQARLPNGHTEEEVKPESQGVHKIQTRIDEEVKPESQGVHKIQTRSGKARIDHRGDSKQGSFIHREEVKRGSQDVHLPKPILQTSSVYTLYILFSVLLAVAVFAIFKSKVDNKSEVIKAFRDQFRGVQSFYPAQSEALRLSKRILELHLNRSKENTQPAIILLAAAQDAQQTLHCLSNHLAKAYSRSRNSSYMVISGENETFHSSEETKLAIDYILSSGFQTTSTAAVLHRLELLHSGALLILYKYCDHENAAFKNVALILTVVLEDSTLAPQLSLTELEEKVRDSLYDQFSGTHNGRSHSEMDRDKLGGVWSRISHAVLPVYPEKSIQEACRDTEHGA